MPHVLSEDKELRTLPAGVVTLIAEALAPEAALVATCEQIPGGPPQKWEDEKSYMMEISWSSLRRYMLCSSSTKMSSTSRTSQISHGKIALRPGRKIGDPVQMGSSGCGGHSLQLIFNRHESGCDGSRFRWAVEELLPRRRGLG